MKNMKKTSRAISLTLSKLADALLLRGRQRKSWNILWEMRSGLISILLVRTTSIIKSRTRRRALPGLPYAPWRSLYFGERSNPLLEPLRSESKRNGRLFMLRQETTVPDFTSKDARIAELLDDMHEIQDLKALGDLAEWDQNTKMPEGAAEVRGYQMATLQAEIHEHWTDPKLGSLLHELTPLCDPCDYTHADP